MPRTGAITRVGASTWPARPAAGFPGHRALHRRLRLGGPPAPNLLAPRRQKREAVNNWIRKGDFDAVIDFDAAVRDPDRPTRLRAEYDVGDHLHPNDAPWATRSI